MNERISEVLEIIDQPACTVKMRGGQIIWSNASFQRRFGHVLTFLEIVREDDHGQAVELLAKLEHPRALTHNVAGPASRRFEWMAAPHPDGTATLVAAAPAPMLARLDALERQNRQLEEFVYVVSHDLNEPLRMVTSFTQLLEEDYGDALDDEATTYIRFATDGASRMQRQLKDLLTYSRVNTRGQPSSSFAAQSALDDACARLVEKIDASGAKVTADELGPLYADYDQVVELFAQLIDNAIQFSGDATPVVRVTSEATGNWCRISVTDNGIGLDSQQHQRMLQIFKRLRPREGTGTGVGLALCRRIVERHGGSIRLETPEDGAGLRVSFTLPALST